MLFGNQRNKMKLKKITKMLFSALATAALGLLSISHANSQQLIKLDLGGGFGIATGINDSGTVVGQAETSSGNYVAFLYSNGTMHNLGTYGSTTTSSAESINNAGQVAGASDSPEIVGSNTYAFIYLNGTFTNLGTLGGNPTNTAPFAINNSGKVVGYSTVSNGITHAFIDSNGSITDIGTLAVNNFSEATAVNDIGQVVGEAGTNSSIDAFLYSGGKMTNLGTLGGNFAVPTGINNSGQVVGYSNTSGGDYSAFLYSNGVMTNLGSLLEASTLSEAVAINNSGEVLGFNVINNAGYPHIFLYSIATRQVQDLSTTLYSSLLVPGGTAAKGFVALTLPSAMNNEGQIVGEGYYWDGTSYSDQAFLLTPASKKCTPPPCSPTPNSDQNQNPEHQNHGGDDDEHWHGHGHGH